MQYKANSPEDYIGQLPEERKAPMTKLHNLIKDNMPKGLESGMSYGMPAYFVPKSIYPPGYHCKPFPPLPFINIASQKNFIALYHLGLYAKKELHDWFVSEYPKHSKYKLEGRWLRMHFSLPLKRKRRKEREAPEKRKHR